MIYTLHGRRVDGRRRRRRRRFVVDANLSNCGWQC